MMASTPTSNTSIAIDASAITSGTIASARVSGSYTGITGVGTLTAGTWNANTITTGYGGTGLTTFTAANNAIYSTSASALTAGTLPVAAGGTGLTTATAYGLIYGNGTSNFGVVAAGTTGQILVATTGAAPSWGAASSVSVSSISFGTTGLTPSTATQGAVTVAGTLNIANGGTGITSFGTGVQTALGQNTTGSGGIVLATSPTVTTPTVSGNETHTGTAARFLADFSNATVNSRFAFQTSTTNSSTGIYAVPNGTSTAASWQASNAADPTNASKILIATNGSTDVQLVSGINGTGTYLPLTFYNNGSEQMRLAVNGNFGIGTNNPLVKLAISSTDSILVPVGTTAQRPTGATGYLRFNTDLVSFEGYNGTSWGSIGGGATGGGTDHIFYLNDQTVNTSYTIPFGQNAGTFGPIAVAAGATVTIPAGSTWSIV